MTATSPPTTETDRRVWDVVAHASPLLLAAGLAAVLGRAYGWIAFLLPLGPLGVTLVMRLAVGGTPRGWRSLLGFTIVCGVAIGGGWVLMAGSSSSGLLVYAFPLALLLFTMGLLNFVMVTVSRAVRAWRGQTFDYPWVISPVRQVVGLGDVYEE